MRNADPDSLGWMASTYSRQAITPGECPAAISAIVVKMPFCVSSAPRTGGDGERRFILGVLTSTPVYRVLRHGKWTWTFNNVVLTDYVVRIYRAAIAAIAANSALKNFAKIL